MSFEINPVLAGKFDTPDNGTANSAANINAAVTGETGQTTAVDSRRYTQFDHSVTDAGTADLKFSDVLDMFNPLEHIPVVSSIYRSIVGEEINPVSRVVGDVIYGGVFGIGSAVLGGMGAIGDSQLAQGTGKDSSGQIIAALFGTDDDKKNSVQLADANSTSTPPAPPAAAPVTTTQKIELAQNTTPSMTAAMAISGNAPTAHSENAPPPVSSSAGTIPDQTADDAGASNAEASANPAAPSPPAPPKPDGASPSLAPSGTIPLLASTGSKSAKQPFGGVMGQPNTQAQDMAIALAQGAPSMKLGHMIYTNPLVTGQHPLPPMLSKEKQPVQNTVPANALPSVTPASLNSSTDPMAMLNAMSLSNPGTTGMSPMSATQLSPDLAQDMMLKALSQYRSMASSPNNPGSTLNLTN